MKRRQLTDTHLTRQLGSSERHPICDGGSNRRRFALKIRQGLWLSLAADRKQEVSQ